MPDVSATAASMWVAGVEGDGPHGSLDTRVHETVTPGGLPASTCVAGVIGACVLAPGATRYAQVCGATGGDPTGVTPAARSIGIIACLPFTNACP